MKVFRKFISLALFGAAAGVSAHAELRGAVAALADVADDASARPAFFPPEEMDEKKIKAQKLRDDVRDHKFINDVLAFDGKEEESCNSAGEDCEDNSDCCSGSCQICRYNSSKCDGCDYDTEPSYSEDYCNGNGIDCKRDTDCCSGICSEGYWRESWLGKHTCEECRSNREECEHDSDCCSGNCACTEAFTGCILGCKESEECRSNGEDCDKDSDCCSGNCGFWNECKEKKEDKEDQ